MRRELEKTSSPLFFASYIHPRSIFKGLLRIHHPNRLKRLLLSPASPSPSPSSPIPLLPPPFSPPPPSNLHSPTRDETREEERKKRCLFRAQPLFHLFLLLPSLSPPPPPPPFFPLPSLCTFGVVQVLALSFSPCSCGSVVQMEKGNGRGGNTPLLNSTRLPFRGTLS